MDLTLPIKITNPLKVLLDRLSAADMLGRLFDYCGPGPLFLEGRPELRRLWDDINHLYGLGPSSTVVTFNEKNIIYEAFASFEASLAMIQPQKNPAAGYFGRFLGSEVRKLCITNRPLAQLLLTRLAANLYDLDNADPEEQE